MAPNTLHPEYQYVWSLRYIDAAIFRDENDGGDDDCYPDQDANDERVYYLNDANMNVTAVLEYANGHWQVAERYGYQPYGTTTARPWSASTTRGIVCARSTMTTTVMVWATRAKDEILNFCKHRITLGPLEPFNNVVSRIIHRACGVRDLDCLFLKLR